MKSFKLNRSKCFIGLFVLGAAIVAASAFADGFSGFQREHIVLTRSVYKGDASTVTVGQTLPGGGKAVADGSYPYVFNNATNPADNYATVDGSFGVTSPIYLDELTPRGTPHEPAE